MSNPTNPNGTTIEDAMDGQDADPRQQIGTDLLDSIREKAIDAANAKVDEFCRSVQDALGRLLGESALNHDASALNADAIDMLLLATEARRNNDEGTWECGTGVGGRIRHIIARETRRITDAITSAAANSVVPVEGTIGGPGQCCRLTSRIDAAHKRGTPGYMRQYREWIADGVRRGVLVDLTA